MDEQFKPVFDALVKQLSALTGQTAEQLGPFARRHVPLVAKWAASRKRHLAEGNEAAAHWDERSIRQAKKAAVLEAAILGVNVQAATEEGILKAFDVVLGLLK